MVLFQKDTRDPVERLKSKYTYANEAIVAFANRVLTEFHSCLREARFIILMKEGTWKSNGKYVYARTSKVSDRDRLLYGADYVITINADIWGHLPEKKRMALLDHEFCHCVKEEDEHGNPIWKTIGHDTEEFGAIIKRHGLWTEELQAFMHNARQMNLLELPRVANES